MEASMPDLNDAKPEPPPEAQAQLQENEEKSRELDSSQRTNDSTIQPDKPPQDILKGFHGG